MSQAYDELCCIAGKVSRETFIDLQHFEAMFLHWAQRINLAAPSTLDAVWPRHILDSAQLFPLAPHAKSWVDVGSGGGFPGLVLAFLLRDRGTGRIDLIESNRKKAGFLQAVVGQFQLPAKVHAVRIEAAARQPELVEGVEIITARALASLADLLDLSAPWISKGATGLFHKGRDYRSELQESINRWSFDLVEHQSSTDEKAVILEISSLQRSPARRANAQT